MSTLLCSHNNSSVQIGMPAVNGVATARSLARTYELLRTGQLISTETLDSLKKPLIDSAVDGLMGLELSKGAGFLYTKNPFVSRESGQKESRHE